MSHYCSVYRLLISITGATLLVLTSGFLRADMSVLETERLRIVYFEPGPEYLVPYATQSFLGSLTAQETRFGYVPEDKVTVLLKDFSDYGNAAATLGAPQNRIFMEIAPANLAFETLSAGERLFTIANHELVHITTSDLANSEDEFFRSFFKGKVFPVSDHPESILYFYLTNPRASAPSWYHEGSASFMETWFAGGLGRAQGGYDEMVFRGKVRDGTTFYDPLGLISKGVEVDFHVGGNAYLYGTRFMSYLALQYSPEKLLDWLRRDKGTLRGYSSDFERVYAMPIKTAWQEWIDWEQDFQRKNLESVNEYPVTTYKKVAKRGLGAVSRAYLSKDRSTLYAAVRYPGQVPSLVSIAMNDGAVKVLTEVTNAVSYRVTSLAFDSDNEILFFTTNNKNHRNVVEFDIKTGQTRTLLSGARIGDLAYNPTDRSLWGLRTNNGFVMMVRIPYPYTQWETLHVFPYGEVPFDLDVSPDGGLVSASFAGLDPSGAQNMEVRVMRASDLLAGDPAPIQKFQFGTAIPEGFVFSDDGKYLFGSSYYTGVSNIFRFEIATGELTAWTNAEVGFFHPVPISDSEMLVFAHTADGFVPALIQPQQTEDLSAITFLGDLVARQHPVVQEWGIGPPSQVDYQSQITRQGPYEPLRELELEALYPVIEGYKDAVSLGISARFSDPVGFDEVVANLGYSPDNALQSSERTHASASFRHGMWSGGLKYNAADFYDLFGPTKRSREGHSAHLKYQRPLLYNPPETLNMVAEGAYYGNLDSLPNFQNIGAPSELLEMSLGLEYKGARSSIGEVDEETGYNWSLTGHLYGSEGDVVPGVFGQFDIGYPLSLDHSSIWLRTAAGGSYGDADDPLANAFFGGFGNNYVDNGDVKRYRDMLRMPGFEIDALGGRTFAKTMLEWNVSPIRFEAVGTPAFYISWARPALFTSALTTDFSDSNLRQDAFNIGAQIDFKIQVMHRLPMMLSLGYAKGYAQDSQSGTTEQSEWMISLKVL